MSEEKIIHDPIHGSIKVSGLIRHLLDAPEVQRLRGIRQLGLSNIVFPGANHTRFEHALGTSYLVKKLSSELELNDRETELLIATAMLHDVGHSPFSHTLEYLMREYLGKTHMDLTEDVLRGRISTCEDEELGELKELGADQTSEILNRYEIDPLEITELISGIHKIPYLVQIIHGNIDVDQMDYLSRDAHYTGVALGRIDLDRLMKTLTLQDEQLSIERKGVEAVEGLLTARALMYSSVYFHHTTRTAEIMLANAVDYAINHDTPIKKDNFFRLDDSKLFEKLGNIDDFPREIITRIRYRRLFKTAYYVEQKELDSKEGKHFLSQFETWSSIREKQEKIAEKANVEGRDVMLDIPIIDLLVSEPRMKMVDVPVIENGKTYKLSDISPLAPALKRRQTPRYLLRVITPQGNVNGIAEASEEVLNEY